MDIFQEIKSFHLPKGKYIVGGGAALEAYGIRKATDIDIAVTKDVYRKLKNDGWKERVVNGNKGLTKGRVDLAVGYMCGRRRMGVSTLLKTARIINGVAFINLRQIIKIKKDAGRLKDVRDIRLIKQGLDH